jgi:hypothetical protein
VPASACESQSFHKVLLSRQTTADPLFNKGRATIAELNDALFSLRLHESQQVMLRGNPCNDLDVRYENWNAPASVI